jgi:hypothetical protein
MVYNISGSIAYNGSLNDQTFASASYDISDDYIVDRPEKKSLINQDFNGRLAHSFSSVTNIDITGTYNIAENPESLLNGVPLNTDQSYNRAQLDARFTTATGEKTGLVAKYRFIDYAYDSDSLANQLDHTENLAGLEASYAMLPETKLVAEYRYQDISYGTAGALKDKTSNFLMAGSDYNPGKLLLVSGRLGFEARERANGGDKTVPYVELTSRYTYAEGSFFSAGYTYSLEEPSDPNRYTDQETNRFLVNLQHRISSALTASGSLTYEPSHLLGRVTVPNIDEKTTRFGLALTWTPAKSWAIAATYDLDNVNSEDPNRAQNRDRFGVNAHYSF